MVNRIYNFKICFHQKEFNFWDGTVECESDYEIISDILLFYKNFMIINDLSNTYVNQFDLFGISNLKIELIKKY